MIGLILKAGREKSLVRRHPWIFSGAVERLEGTPASGETVDIFAADGRWLACGAYSPQSQIRVRIWSFIAGQAIDAGFFRARLARAVTMRADLPEARASNGRRLVFGESDGLPGTIIDQYGEYLVCQFLSAGAERWRATLVEELRDLVPCKGIYERSDVAVRLKEGLASRSGLLAGDEPPPLVEIEEEGCRFLIDIRQGHKTGFYLDQRANRSALAAFAAGAEILNCFSYTGGFGVSGLRHNAAQVTNIDSAAPALRLAERQLALNSLDLGRATNTEGDVFEVLRKFRDKGCAFDIVVLDPPKFAEAAAQLTAASRAYKDINLLAFKLLRPGGYLFTFSCSGNVSADLFQKIVAGALLDAGREAQIIRFLEQSADHPVALNFPESRYLKGLLARVW